MNKEINPIVATFLLMSVVTIALAISKFIGAMNDISWWIVTMPLWGPSFAFIAWGVISFVMFMKNRPEE